MKKKLLLSATILILVTTNSFATIHMIMVADFQFTPANGLTVHPGDTVMWMWQSGFHTTTSEGIPATASHWNDTLSSSNTSFMYVPAVLGTYNYECTIHASMGMVGSFAVVSAAGVSQVGAASVFTIYPNPIKGSVHVQYNKPGQPVSIIVSDLSGREMIRKQYGPVTDADLNVQNIPNGMYIIRAEQGSDVYSQQLVIEH